MNTKKLLVLTLAAVFASGVLFPRDSGAQSLATDVAAVGSEVSPDNPDAWRGKLAPDLLDEVDLRSQPDNSQLRIESASRAKTDPIVDADGYADVIVKLKGKFKRAADLTDAHREAIASVGG